MLIVDDKWLLIGPNRHGSLYCRDVLSAAFECRPSSGDKPHHTPLCRIPPEVRAGKIIVGIVRCPLRWYLSKWRVFWEHAPPEKRYNFSAYFWKHWTNPHGPIGKATEDFPLAKAEIGGWSYQHIAYHCESAEGMLTEWTRRELAEGFGAERSVRYMLHTETLTDDLIRLFGDKVRPHLDKPRNATDSGDVLSHYTVEMLEAIRKRDGWLAYHYPELDYHKFMEKKLCF
jgi:hypothetical protein